MSSWSDLLPRLTEQPRENGTRRAARDGGLVGRDSAATWVSTSARSPTPRIPIACAWPACWRWSAACSTPGACARGAAAGAVRRRRRCRRCCCSSSTATCRSSRWIGRDAAASRRRPPAGAAGDAAPDPVRALRHQDRPARPRGARADRAARPAGHRADDRRRGLGGAPAATGTRPPLPRLARIAVRSAPLYGLGLFASLSAGAFVPRAQPGRARRRRRLRRAASASPSACTPPARCRAPRSRSRCCPARRSACRARGSTRASASARRPTCRPR